MINWNNINVRVYGARGMSGRIQSEVVQEAREDKLEFEEAGIQVLCPVEKENVKSVYKKLQSTETQMNKYWPQDKEMFRKSHVFVNFTPHINSQGAWREYGKCRYFFYKPCVHIFPQGQLPPAGNVSYYEDDLVTDDFEYAIKQIKARWGSPKSRLVWRLKLLRKLPKAFYEKAFEWLNVIS